jgi:dTDP-4-amino-4,6-dideoxygalactose transaminase
VYHLFVIRSPLRDRLQKALADKNIQTGIHYPIALPKLEAYRYLNCDFSSFFSCNQDHQLLSLPIGEHLSTDDIYRVCDIIKGVCYDL